MNKWTNLEENSEDFKDQFKECQERTEKITIQFFGGDIGKYGGNYLISDTLPELWRENMTPEKIIHGGKCELDEKLYAKIEYPEDAWDTENDCFMDGYDDYFGYEELVEEITEQAKVYGFNPEILEFC